MSSCLRSQFGYQAKLHNFMSQRHASRLVLRCVRVKTERKGCCSSSRSIGSFDHPPDDILPPIKECHPPGCHAGQSQDLPVALRPTFISSQKVERDRTYRHVTLARGLDLK
jgi:hypothetical protein